MTLVCVSACSDGGRVADPGDRVPGTLAVVWSTPNGAEGAVRIELEGPGLGDVTAAQPGALVFSRTMGNRQDVALFGDMTSGVLVRFDVPDVQSLALYQVRLVEVAEAATNELRTDLTKYTLMLQ